MFDLDLKKYRVVDISQLVVPPGDEARPFKIEKVTREGKRQIRYNITTHTHVGAHVETPFHFIKDGKDPSDFPVTYYMGRALLVNAEENQAVNAKYLKEIIGNKIRLGDIIVFRNVENNEKGKNLPYLTEDAARWLVEKKVKMLAYSYDFFALGNTQKKVEETHDIMMKHDISFVEFLDNLEKLEKKEFYFMALPFKVKGIDSAWVRAIVIEEK